jgi:MFS family permease
LGISLTPGGVAEWRAHWPTIVAATLGLALSSLHVYCGGAFVLPIEQDLGWSRAEIASGLTAATMVGAILSPFGGLAVDRFGARTLAVPGVILYCVAFGMLSLTTRSPWSWWVLWLMVGTMTVLIKGTVWTAGIAMLFRESRGLALAIVLCGGSLASTIVPFLTTRLIDAYGWRNAFAGLAALSAIVVIPVVLLFFRGGGGVSLRKGGTGAGKHLYGPTSAKAGLLSLQFFKLCLAATAIAGAIVPTSINLIPILATHGFTREGGAGIAALVGVSSIIGRLVTGHFIDRYDPRLIGGFATALPVVSFLLLLVANTTPIAVTAILLLGLSLGAEVDIIAYMVGRYFGTRIFGTIMGMIFAFLTLATGLVPLYAGWIYDQTGSYSIYLLTCIPMALLSSALLFLMGKPPVFDVQVVAPPPGGDPSPAILGKL